MTATLEPTPELVAAARRVATRTWTVEHDEPAYPPADRHLAQLVDAGLVVLHFPVTRLRLDHWTLTVAGREWLAAHTEPIDRKEAP